MKKNKDIFLKLLNKKYPNPTTELNYVYDYELLIAVMLSAQTTDIRVNSVTKKLFDKYDSLEALNNSKLNDIKKIIKSVGTFNRKAVYIKDIARDLVVKYNSKVPSCKKELQTLSGVGRKTANVVTSILFKEPSIAVDTHVKRVSQRMGFVLKKDNEYKIEQKLMKLFDKKDWSKIHHQMVLFGRYDCKAIKPNCSSCELVNICTNKNKR